MADQVPTDSRGVNIGAISTASDGVQTIRDERGVKKGPCDPKTNATRDERGVKVGARNLLTALL